MALPKEKVKCLKCGHVWKPKSKNLPQRCPSCLSPFWNRPTGDIVKTKKHFSTVDGCKRRPHGP